MIDSLHLIEIVDVFKCCLFTWGALTTILPAFIFAGAIATFMPSYIIPKYLGPKARKIFSYPFASFSGQVLPTCSCNVVPLFLSILKKGAGLGPSFIFLYAAPAINIVGLAFTFKIIGPILGIWRFIGVIVISITVGLIMAVIFREKDSALTSSTNVALEINEEQKKNPLHLIIFFSLLFLILLVGSTIAGYNPLRKIDPYLGYKISGWAILIIALAVVSFRYFAKEELKEWFQETFTLARKVLPIFIVVVFIIGLITKYIDIRIFRQLLAAHKDASGHRIFSHTLKSTFLATLFGGLMYFPLLTEVAFTKAFLKLGMDVGPALGILLSGPGTSLPGLILIQRYVGWKKVLVYFLLSLGFETIFGVALAMHMGDYICACLMLD